MPKFGKKNKNFGSLISKSLFGKLKSKFHTQQAQSSSYGKVQNENHPESAAQPAVLSSYGNVQIEDHSESAVQSEVNYNSRKEIKDDGHGKHRRPVLAWFDDYENFFSKKKKHK